MEMSLPLPSQFESYTFVYLFMTNYSVQIFITMLKKMVSVYISVLFLILEKQV